MEPGASHEAWLTALGLSETDFETNGGSSGPASGDVDAPTSDTKECPSALPTCTGLASALKAVDALDQYNTKLTRY